MHGYNELLSTVYVNIPSITTTLCATYMVCIEIKQHEPYIWLPYMNVLVMCTHICKTISLLVMWCISHRQDGLSFLMCFSHVWRKRHDLVGMHRFQDCICGHLWLYIGEEDKGQQRVIVLQLL